MRCSLINLSAKPQRPCLDQRHNKSERRMGCASNNGSIPLERGPALHDPGPGLHLRCGRHTPTAPASPSQNGFVERLIGSIRRERVDHTIVLSEAHLRWILRSYARYYNETRTHLALHKDAPIWRPIQQTGAITSNPILGGLHHHYIRI